MFAAWPAEGGNIRGSHKYNVFSNTGCFC